MKLNKPQKIQVALFFLLGELIVLLIVFAAITGHTLLTCPSNQITDCCVYEIVKIKLVREIEYFIIAPFGLGLFAGIFLAQHKYNQIIAQKSIKL